ncbi:hypothetical protein ABPG77_009536 [Micractinium sp. CCAP 211/92]
MEDIPSDPDRFALAIVQQWLADQGYTQALAALECEAGLHVRHEVQRGSQLLQLVYDHMEALAAASLDEAAAERRALEERLLAGGSASGPGDCPSRLRAAIDGAHPANITALACWPAARQFATGSADGSVRLLGYDGALLRSVQAGSSGVLCLAAQPGGGPCSASSHGGASSSGGVGDGPGLVAAGCMDGSIAVLDLSSICSGTEGGSDAGVLARASPHRKYVVAAAWDPSGCYLATASWDHSFAVLRLQRSSDGRRGGGTGTGWELATVHTEHTTGRVNALQFLPPLADGCGNHGGSCEASHAESCGPSRDAGSADGSQGGSSFLLAVQGSNYLRQVRIAPAPAGGASAPGSDGAGRAGTAGAAAAEAGTAAAAVHEERRINLNGPGGDDHVSFSAAHLALSPCGHMLLVSADNGRLVLYERAGWTQLRSIIGLPTEQFHQFSAAWHRSGHYIMAAAAHGRLCIFHRGSAKRVATVAAHAKNLRALAYDGTNNLLLTCSFDRTVKVWEAAGAGGRAAECQGTLSSQTGGGGLDPRECLSAN